VSAIKVFADTHFYLALMRVDDPAHELASAAAESDRPIVTTEFIILELGNACCSADDHGDFLALVQGMRTSPRITVVPLHSHLMERGIRLMARRPDKNWSLTDCISFTVMDDIGISEALTADHHFEQAGFRALLKAD
jgi:predicted nucleic acid-binding protein